MSTQKRVRRVFFAAAVSTASLIVTANSEVFGWESTGSGIQRVQYQPAQTPQSTAQPNAAVTAELKRMFEESGQSMPSMMPGELPNAQGQQMNKVRPTQRPNTPQANMRPPAPPQSGVQQTGMQQQPNKQQPQAKQNFLKRFMGKVSGQDKKAAEAAVVPPVPPGFREPAPAPPVDAPSIAQGQPVQGQQSMINARPAGMQTNSNGQTRVNAQPASGSQVRPQNSSNVRQSPAGGVAPVRTAQATQSTVPAQTISQPSQPVPDVPVGAGSAIRSRSTVAQPPVNRAPQYVQPGTAPAFMPSTASHSTAANSSGTSVAASSTPKNAPKPMPAKLAQPDDGLDELFDESGSSDNSGEMLDLDALVEAVELPVPQPADATPSDAATPVPVAAEQKKPAAAEIAESDGNDGSNPFTGIRLDDSDEETFDPSLSAGTAGNGTSSETTGSTAEVDFGQATNEFEASLPAINLPAVEDFQTSSDDTAATSADLGFPELDAADRAEAASNKTNTSSAQAFSKKPSGKVETEATPLRSMDTEKLQQVAEQDRLQRQRRQIQSRAGQAGFKGFCPVELRDRRELIDTNPEFTATFGLQTYSFSSAAAKTAFEADPSRYAPAAGGSDVVLLVNSGEEQPGMLDYALWYRDRLYLFRSRETMAMFNQDPLRFANQY